MEVRRDRQLVRLKELQQTKLMLANRQRELTGSQQFRLQGLTEQERQEQMDQRLRLLAELSLKSGQPQPPTWSPSSES